MNFLRAKPRKKIQNICCMQTNTKLGIFSDAFGIEYAVSEALKYGDAIEKHPRPYA